MDQDLAGLLAEIMRTPGDLRGARKLLAAFRRAGRFEDGVLAYRDRGLDGDEATRRDDFLRTVWESGFGLGDPALQLPSPIHLTLDLPDGDHTVLATETGDLWVLARATWSRRLAQRLPAGIQTLVATADGSAMLAGAVSEATLHLLRVDLGESISSARVDVAVPGPGPLRLLSLAGQHGAALVESGDQVLLVSLEGWGPGRSATASVRPLVCPPGLRAATLTPGACHAILDTVSDAARPGLGRGVDYHVVDLAAGSQASMSSERHWVSLSWTLSPDGRAILGQASRVGSDNRPSEFTGDDSDVVEYLNLLVFDLADAVVLGSRLLENQGTAAHWSADGRVACSDPRGHQLWERDLTECSAWVPPVPLAPTPLLAGPGPGTRHLVGSGERPAPWVHRAKIEEMTCLRGSPRLATRDRLGDVVLWDLERGLPTTTLRGSLLCDPLVFTDDGEQVLRVENTRARIERPGGVVTQVQSPLVPWNWGSLAALATISGDGRFVLTGERGGKLRLVDARTGEELATLQLFHDDDPVFGGRVLALGILADGRRAWAIGPPGTRLVLLRLPELEVIREWSVRWPMRLPNTERAPHHINAPTVVEDPSRDALVLPTLGAPSMVASRRAQQPRRLVPSKDGAGILALAPGGTRLAQVTQDGEVEIWDVSGRRLRDRILLERFRPALAPPTALAFTPDGSRLLYSQVCHVRARPVLA